MTDAYRIVFRCLDQNQKLLAEKVTFSFIGTEFNISEVGDTVRYLKITIDTVEALSLLHLFLWQHRQGLMLRSNIQLIIIQDELEASNTAVTEYWRNLASLSLQMGFSTVSFISYSDIGYYKPTNQIIIVSQLLRIDTQQLDTMAGLSQFRFDGKMSYSMKLVILERIGLAAHKQQQYAHLLPMILGYSAYIIYNQIIQYQKQDMEILVEDAGYINNVKSGKTIHLPNFPQIYIHHAQEMYTTATHPSAISYKTTFIDQNRNDRIESFTVRKITQVFKNIFELPVHLLNILDFNDSNQFIFQQMCDVSYLFKAQYFAVFSAFFPLDNAVLSQSSRSGKTVTLHTIFYFNLFSGLQIPILINIGHQYQNSDLQLQPLYNRSSINLGDNLKNIFASSTNISIETIAMSNLNQGLISYNYLSYLVSKINIYIQCFQQEAQTNQIRSAFDQYFSGQTDFNTFKNISLDNFFQINSTAYCEADKNLNQQLNLTNLYYKKTLNEKDRIQLKELKESYKLFIQGQKYDKTQKVIVLVDECLNHQKDNYYQVEKIIVQLVDQYMNKFIDQARSCIEYVLKILVGTTGTQHVHQIQKWLDENTIVDYKCDQSLLNIKEKLAQKIKSILDSDQVEEYFFKQLCYYDLLIDTNASALVDLIVISSPNFIDVKTSIINHKFFSEMMINLKEYPNRAVFKQQLYHFLIMLYNPRSMETIFWRNLSYAMNYTNQPPRFTGIDSINYKLYAYFIDSSNSFDKFIVQLNSIFKIRFDLSSSLNYQEIQIITHGNCNFLSAGTDLALINSIRQNQFIYTSESSRGQVQYTQSNILGTSQMHSSCLTQHYYQGMQIAALTDDSMIQYVKKKVIDMSIKDFYLTTVPALAAEMQFLCPLVCPQIIINKRTNAYFFNSTQQFQFTINQKSIPLHQISSHMQIHNSLFIIRQGQQVGVNQRIDQKCKQVLFKPQSIAEFNKHLHLTSSSTLNRDVVFVLHFLASQRFLDTLTMLNGESDQAQLSQLCTTGQIEGLLKQQQISEISSAIIIIVSLCRQQPTHMSGLTKLFKQVITYSQYLEIYMNPLQVQQNNIPTLKEIYAQFQSLFKGAFFMFLQKSFDKYWYCTTPDINMYVGEAIQNASVCYIKLKQLGLLQEDEKLAIVTITDKTCISNLFVDTSPPMPDYLISLFGVEDTIINSFSNKSMLSNLGP